MLQLTEYQWIITAIGWTIIHSIWQIALIGLLWFLGIRSLDKSKSGTKYNFSILTLLLVAIISIGTLISQLQSRIPVKYQTPNYTEVTNEADFPLAEIPNEPSNTNEIKDLTIQEQYIESESTLLGWFNSFASRYLVLFWTTGVLVLGVRFLIQWLDLKRLATQGTIPFATDQLKIFHQLQKNIGIKKTITFLQSTLVRSPLTFGHFKPVILIPIGMATGFSQKQIEAIILHELAHIRRNDYLINAMQIWLEIIFFYHPLIWLISKNIRATREELCDDHVIAINHDKILYAEALVKLQKYIFHQKNQLIMNATNEKSELTNRIHRLFSSQTNEHKGKSNIQSYILGLILIAAIGSYAFTNFSYPTVSVSADKMNVLYVGVDNPITVAVAGIASEKVKVESETLTIEHRENGHYNVTASESGTATIKVTAEGHASKEIVFRVKYIPAPTAMINNKAGGTMSPENMSKLTAFDLNMSNFVFDINCTIESFEMIKVGKNSDPVSSINNGNKFNEKTLNLIQGAKKGDIYYFDSIKCKCPGDEESRPINSMVFKMK